MYIANLQKELALQKDFASRFHSEYRDVTFFVSFYALKKLTALGVIRRNADGDERIVCELHTWGSPITKMDDLQSSWFHGKMQEKFDKVVGIYKCHLDFKDFFSSLPSS